MPTLTYELAVDWNNDGDFIDANEDITSYVLTLRAERGRFEPSTLSGKAIAGRLTAELNNTNGIFSSFNTSSPLSGNLLPGRPVRWRVTSPSTVTLWQGHLDQIIPLPTAGRTPRVRLIAHGVLAKAAGTRVNTPLFATIYTGAAVNRILDEIGIATSTNERAIDAGQLPINRWWADDRVTALEALREVEDSEPGFLYESGGGRVVFEDRRHRLVSPHTVSQANYSDAAGATLPYEQVIQEDPLRYIVNRVHVPIERLYDGATGTPLWSMDVASGAVPFLDIGESRVFTGLYPQSSSPANHRAVRQWTTGAIDPGVTANSASNGLGTNLTTAIGVSYQGRATRIDVTLTNNATVGAYITALSTTGTPITAGQKSFYTRDSTGSQARYDVRQYQFPGDWLSGTPIPDAQDRAGWIIGSFQDPIPILRVQQHINRSSALITERLTREISDRVTVVATNTAGLGINEDFFIEQITDVVTHRGGTHRVIYTLSPASVYGGFWVLGTSLLGVSTKLAW